MFNIDRCNFDSNPWWKLNNTSTYIKYGKHTLFAFRYKFRIFSPREINTGIIIGPLELNYAPVEQRFMIKWGFMGPRIEIGKVDTEWYNCYTWVFGKFHYGWGISLHKSLLKSLDTDD